MRIYKDQDFKLSLTSTEAIDQAVNKIKYITPTGETGSHDNATLVGTKTLEKDIQCPVAGLWIFWIYSIYGDGQKIPTEPLVVRVYNEGE